MARLGRVLLAVVERACRGWLADRGDAAWVLRTARPVEAIRLHKLTEHRVLKEEDAILEEAMFWCTGCAG